jgi:predicted AAA+ superfamily ATPase
MGRFVLTGSQQFHLASGITQSLAGRAVTLELLPFSVEELETGGRENLLPQNINELLIKGMYPPIYDRSPDPALWYSAYIRNYVERDVRAISNILNLDTFQRFIRLLAARVGQLINFTELGVAAGITHNTTKAWISILEASYIIFTVRPFHTNFSKRLVKTPKIYFYDPGLLCRLLSIQDADQLDLHPLRGAVFESFICAELLKTRYNSLQDNNLYFWRDRSGNEIDLILDNGQTQTPLEIKAGKTFQTSFLKQINTWASISGSPNQPILIYGGDEDFEHQGCRVLPWRSISNAS